MEKTPDCFHGTAREFGRLARRRRPDHWMIRPFTAIRDSLPSRLMKLSALFLSLAFPLGALAKAEKPNIVVILADDLGYGDVGCYGAKAIRTPNIDKVAAGGLRFTNGRSTAATCTPSRYSLMTGQYPWRKPGTNILPGDANLIIPPGTTTLPSILRKAGYATAAIGKWHLGLGTSKIDWNADLKPGPLEIGFQEAFFLPATGDRVPTVLIENHRVAGLDPSDPLEVSYQVNFSGQPTGKDNPGLLKLLHSHGHNQSIHEGIGRIGYQQGGKAARWSDETLADTFAARALRFIESKKDQPFFLYFATHDIHVPRVPHPRFAGQSGLGPRGDVILQLDWTIGEITGALQRLGLADNTLLLISSDNGPVLDDGYQDDAVRKLGGHTPSGPWRGGKSSAFEAGTRVPFIVRWPARIRSGVSHALVGQIDLLASFAGLTGQSLAGEDAPDSIDVLPALLGESAAGRESLILQGAAASVIRGDWKFIEPVKAKNVIKRAPNTDTETGRDHVPQLYDLAKDPGETTNLAEQHPEIVTELSSILGEARGESRTRPHP